MAVFGTFIGVLLSGGNFFSALPIFASVFFICAGGMVINDYFGRVTDSVVKPEKVKRMSVFPPRFWLSYSCILFLLGIVLAAYSSFHALVIALFNTVLLVVYPARLKGIPLLGNFVVSYLVASTFLFGATLTGEYSAAAILSVLAFLTNTSREILKDVSDLRGDRVAGLKTLAVVNRGLAVVVSRILLALAVFLSPIPYISGILGPGYLYGLVPTVFFLGAAALKNSEKLIKLGMFSGLIAFLLGVVL